jgi:hypothetical protein
MRGSTSEWQFEFMERSLQSEDVLFGTILANAEARTSRSQGEKSSKHGFELK